MTHKKKLLVFHPALPPYRIDLFNGLADQLDTKFYFFNDNLLNQKFNQEKLSNDLTFEPEFLKSGFNLHGRSFRFGVGRIIQKEKPDIIFCPEYNLGCIAILLHKWVSKQNFKIYSICDDSIQKAADVFFCKRLLRTFLLRYLDGIILTHDEIREWYRKELDPATDLIVFPIIRDEKRSLEKVARSRERANKFKREHRLEGKKVFLFVGRLAPEKNLPGLLQAVSLIRESEKDLRIIIVGSGSEEEKLKKMITELNLKDMILMVGRYEGKDLWGWYLLANVFVLPSFKESFGAVINEALLAGCYTLVSRTAGGSCLITPGINGELFDPMNIEELAKTMLFTLQKDDIYTEGLFFKNRMTVSFQDLFQNLKRSLD